MFEHFSYLGYTLLFCLPPIVLLWVRAEFARTMREDLRGILLATAIISLYGSAIWPVAIRWGCWSYREDRILNRKLFGVVYVEDVVWWVLVSFLLASFVALSTRWERSGRDVVAEELSGLWRAFRDAFAGFRAAGLERNMAIHTAAATGTLMAAWLFRLSRIEWLFVILAVAGVMAAELLNCAVERLAPSRNQQWSSEVRLVKDAAAAGVLVTAVAAAVIGAVIFLPRALAAFR
ncbi:MAG: diacylglycerol kinase family protein [Bryobacteraceae bacterium]